MATCTGVLVPSSTCTYTACADCNLHCDDGVCVCVVFVFVRVCVCLMCLVAVVCVCAEVTEVYVTMSCLPIVSDGAATEGSKYFELGRQPHEFLT